MNQLEIMHDGGHRFQRFMLWNAFVLLLNSPHAIALSFPNVCTSRHEESSKIINNAVTRTTKKGKEFQQHHTEEGFVSNIRAKAEANSGKVFGSKSYMSAWRNWSLQAIEQVQTELAFNLPVHVEVDHEATAQLQFELGVGADKGLMPSFSDAGARAGYALGFFRRSRLLADLLMDALVSKTAFAKDLGAMFDSSGKKAQVVSIGGGPGYDFCSCALVSVFYATVMKKTPRPLVNCKVFDYEDWSDLVAAMGVATKNTLGPEISERSSSFDEHSCEWGGRCDITLPLSHPSNTGVQAVLASTDLFTCQYCVAENAAALRGGSFCFFRELLAGCRPGAVLVLTETTHRLWPELADVVREVAAAEGAREGGRGLGSGGGGGALGARPFEVVFPGGTAGRGKVGRQMVVRRRRPGEEAQPAAPAAGAGARWAAGGKEGRGGGGGAVLEAEFRRHGTLHARKVARGWERQTRKVRGAKG